MKYRIGITIDGRVYLEVKADSLCKAREKAIELLLDMDLDNFESIWRNAMNAEDDIDEFEDYE